MALKMKKRTLYAAIVLALPGVLASPSAWALGMGEITLHSALNEPLEASIELFQLDGLDESQIRAALASESDFSRSNIPRPAFLGDIRFEIEVLPGNRGVLHLSSDTPVVEPYLNFLVDTRWPSGRMLSEYTLLLDLPTFSDSPAAPVQAAQRTPAPQPEPEPAARVPIDAGAAPANPVAAQAPDAQASAAQEQAPPAAAGEQSLSQAAAQPEPEAMPEPEPAPEPVRETAAPAQVAAAPAEPEPLQEEEPEPAALAAAEPEPAIEPEPEPPVEPEPEAERGPTSVEVEANDTMWEIALRTRPDNSVSVQQMMLAIQRSNEDAFIDGNINAVMSGSVLRIPDIDEILALNREQAMQEVAQQNTLFSGGLGNEPLASASPGAGGAGAAAGDELSVLTEGESGNPADAGEDLQAVIAELENELMLSEEGLDRAAIENQELNSRLADLDAQVETLDNIIAIEDQRLAQLQAELAARAEAEAEAGQQDPAQLAQAAAAEPAAQAGAQTAAAQPEPQPPQAAPPVQTAGRLDSLMQNPLVMGGGLAALVLLVLGFLVWRRRMDEEGREDEGFHPAGEVALGDEEAASGDAMDEEDEEEAAEEGGRRGAFAALGSLMSRGARGRGSEESEEVERAEEPALSEAYAEAAEGAGAVAAAAPASRWEASDADTEQMIEELELDDFSESDFEEEIKAAGRRFQEADEAPADETRTALSAEDLDATVAPLDVPEQEYEQKEEEEEDGAAQPAPESDAAPGEDEDFEFSLDDEEEAGPGALAGGEEEDTTLDFSLDEAVSEAAEEAPDGETPAEAEAESFEFQLEEAAPEAPAVEAPAEEEAETLEFKLEDAAPAQPADEAPAEAEDETETLEFKLDEEAPQPPPEEAADEAEPETFEFTLDEDLGGTHTDPAGESDEAAAGEAEPASAAPEDAGAGESIEFDIEFEDFEEDGEDASRDAGQEDESLLDLGSLDIDEELLGGGEEADEGQPLSDRDEVSTKLDLAVAYEAMGDLDGAREILDEVIEEGTDEQVDEARRLLAEWRKTEGD